MPGDGVTLQTLSLKIEAESSNASKGIESLISTLKKLEKVRGDNLVTFANHIKGLSDSMKSMSMNSVSMLNGLANSLAKIKSVGEVKISSSIGNQIGVIKEAIRDLNASQMASVGDAFEHFRSIGDITISPSLATNLEKLKTALQGWDVDTETIDKIVSSLMPLTTIGKTNLASFVTNVGKIPSKLKELNEVDLTQASANIEKLFNTLSKYGNLGEMADNLKSIANSLKLLKESGGGGGISITPKGERKSFINGFTDLSNFVQSMYFMGGKVVDWITDMAKQTSNYVEDLNLFTVSLGEFSREAQKYGERVANVVGINPGEWLKYQGTFMSLATGFGIAGDKAAIMSQQLTQLGYDLASFYNLNTEEAMRKLQSGISGELEPLRRLGVDLSVARLKEDAHRLGIEEKVQSMTQAEKSMLRYNAIMEQTSLAQNDMARTLTAPSNQLRVLKAQVTQAAQAIGSIFIPVLNSILPVAIAVVKAVRMVAEAIASLFGYTLPEIDYSGLSNSMGGFNDSVEDASSGLGSAAKNAKKLKDYVLGIDELNIIRPDEGTSGGGGGGGGSGGGGSGGLFDIDLKQYDFLNGLIDSSVGKIQEKLQPLVDWITGNLDAVLSMVKNIGLLFLAWKFSKTFSEGLNTLGTMFGLGDGQAIKITRGIILTITGISMERDAGFRIGYKKGNGESASSGDVVEALLGVALGGLGGMQIATALGGSGLVGLGIGVGITLLVGAVSLAQGVLEAKVEQALSERFGELHLEEWQIDEIVKIKLKKVEFQPLSEAIGEFNEASELYKDLSATIETINGYGWKVSVGIELNKDETTDYKTALDQFVSQAQSYVEQQNYAVLVGIKASLGGGAEGSSIYEAFSSSGVDIQNELTNLGLQLNEVVNTAFSDNLLTIDEQKAIADLTSQIAHITAVINGSETKAEFGTINMEYSIENMDYESFDSYVSKMNDGLDDAKERAREVEEKTLQGMYAQRDFYDVDDPQWAILDKAINDYIKQNPLKLRIESLEMEVNNDIWEHLKGAWETELQKGSKELSKVSFYPPETLDLNGFIGWIEGTLKPEVVGAINSSGLSIAEKEALKRQIEYATPKENDLTKELQGYIETGKLIPKNVSEGLHDVKMLKALSGDTTAINYLIGEKLTTDKSFNYMLKTVKGVGASVSDEVAAGIKSHYQLIKDNSTGMVHVFVDGVEEGVYTDTSIIVQNFKDMGIDSVDAYNEGLDTFNPDPAVKTMTDDVTDKVGAKKSLFELVAQGLASGYSTELGNIDKDNIAKKMADIPISETKTKLGWNGKSSNNLDRIAEGSAQGYSTKLSNVDGDNIAKKYVAFYDKVDKEKLPDKIKTLASNINDQFKINPSTGTTDVDTWISGMKTSLGNANFGEKAYKSLKDYFTEANGKSLGETLGSGLKQGIKNKLGNTTVVINKPGKDGAMTVSVRANGGFVDQGEMFIARESGAEMVGRIGSRTAVANNDQIVKGIEGGVSNANARVVDAINTLIQVVADKNLNVSISDTSIGLANDRYASSRGEYIDSSAFANSY